MIQVLIKMKSNIRLTQNNGLIMPKPERNPSLQWHKLISNSISAADSLYET